MHEKIAQTVKLIEGHRVHGAGWLARQAVETLAQAVEEGEEPVEAGRALARARPSIAAVAGAVGRVLAAGKTQEQLLEQCRALLERRDRASHSIAVLLRPDLTGTVMTFSASATVREAVVHARPPRVVCTVTEPHGEGRGLAEELEAERLTVELVADEDASHAVTTVDLLLLGADSVFRDGSLANRAGSAKLIAAANDAGTRVVVASETFKLTPFDGSRDIWDERLAEDDQFDLVPSTAIDRYVTEEGAFAPDEIPALVDRTPFLHEGYEILRGRAG